MNKHINEEYKDEKQKKYEQKMKIKKGFVK